MTALPWEPMPPVRPLGRRDAVPAEMFEVAQAQAHIVTRRQLETVGIGLAAVRAAVAARRWQPLGRRVVVLHNTELTDEQRRWAAVLLFDQPVALAGATAAACAGLRGFDDDRVHVVVDRASEIRTPSWVRVHNSRRFGVGDVNPAARPPRTRAGRSLIDTAAWSRYPRRACAILCAGVQQRIVLASTLDDALREAGHVRHVAIMRSVLGDISGGGHTLAEIDLAPLARRAGLGRPLRQVLRREPNGRARYVDAAFDLPDGSTLLVEIDGAVHLKALNWWDDLSRQNELLIGGDRLLRFDSVTMRLHAERVVDQLVRMRISAGG